MNRILSYTAYFPAYMSAVIEEKGISQLSSIQQKIATIACLTIGILATMYVAYRCFSCGDDDKKSPPHFPYSPKSPVHPFVQPNNFGKKQSPIHFPIHSPQSPVHPFGQPNNFGKKQSPIHFPIHSPQSPIHPFGQPNNFGKKQSPIHFPIHSPQSPVHPFVQLNNFGKKHIHFPIHSPKSPVHPFVQLNNFGKKQSPIHFPIHSPKSHVHPFVQPNNFGKKQSPLPDLDKKKENVGKNKHAYRSTYETSNTLSEAQDEILALEGKLQVAQETLENLLIASSNNDLIIPKAPPSKPENEIPQVNVDEEQLEIEKKDEIENSDILEPEDELEHKSEDEISVINMLQIDDAEAQITQLNNELNKSLVNYLKTFRLYLNDYFQQGRKEADELYLHLAVFSGFMDKSRENEVFVQSSLQQIDEFLAAHFFTSVEESCLPEEKKIDLIAFQELFTVVNKHLPVIQKSNPQLAIKLKIKFANLPLTDHNERSDFANLNLTEKDQVNILTAHLQNKENQVIDAAIQDLQNGRKGLMTHRVFSLPEIRRIAKLAVEKQSHLSKSNLLKFQNALKTLMGHEAPANWKDKEEVVKALERYFQVDRLNDPQEGYESWGSSYQPPTKITALYRTAKAKNFFEKQIGLDESLIQIPRWYHATRAEYISSIISTEVRVEHKQAYKGAWVSTQREPSMGSCTLAFKHSIAKIDPNVFIGYEKGKTRWRGLQKAIPMKMKGPKNDPTLVLVALPSDTFYKDRKKKIKQDVQTQNLTQVKIIENAQLDFVQREILCAIGNPNLSEKWWGKANIEIFEAVQSKNTL